MNAIFKLFFHRMNVHNYSSRSLTVIGFTFLQYLQYCYACLISKCLFKNNSCYALYDYSSRERIYV